MNFKRGSAVAATGVASTIGRPSATNDGLEA